MRFLSLVTALTVASIATAQNCTVPPAQRTFSNREEFASSFYYTNAAYLFDLNAQTSISISGMSTWLYDSGIGNPPTNNQVGATGTVEVYTCATSRIGNESNAPTNPGSPWTLLGTGTITVVATPGESPIVFSPPLSLAAGAYGVAVVFLPTTNGPNPGPLHCLGVNPNLGIPTSDQFVTFSSDGIQGTAWTGTGVDSPNLRMTYTPDANAAHYSVLGQGCYYRPQAFYQVFQPSTNTPPLANTTQTWVNLGPNYAVVPGGVPFTAPGGTNVVASAPGASSCGTTCWDDATAPPITLPFTFPFPGGSTNDITILSNGGIYLAAVTDGSYATNGALYGSIAPFRDNAARIAGYYTDLDPTAGGTINYEVLSGGQAVQITWNAVPEWPAQAGFTNNIQITLDASGNVNIAYGALSNRAVGNGNDACFGFTPGSGSTLPPMIDVTTALPYTSGDGSFPPVLTMDARPVIGTTPNIVTSNIVPGTLLQVLAAGDTLQPFPVDLGFIGMPGCLLQMNPIVLLTNVINPNNTFTQPLAIPNSPVFQNAQLVFQSAPLTSGQNSLGLLLSNGICARMGL